MHAPQADARHVANGFAAAISTATVLPALFCLPMAPALTSLVAIVAIIIACGHALLIALPAYALLSRVWPLRWWNAMIGGAVVGAGPISMLSASDGPSATLRTLALLAPLGAVSGFAFWLAARQRPFDAGLVA